ncbi:helix-turn-helix transcriptional regulator [Planotetraspora phitsanulokensis]|uniref:Transcriptional regulator n=1 Tax=Planotetraspora phitsanulokensis TaxID=575192 RepID=A0A8J3UGW6_9ACTN|nr:transcriptional regulator [Planotetraspora phitsanulokensis]
MTVEQVAQQLLCSPAKISRLETGQRGASLRDVRDLCRIYDVPEETVTHLMNLARESRQPGVKHELGDLGNDNLYMYMDLEAAAFSITELQITFLPALFQTEEYARTLIEGLLPGIRSDVLDRRVEARIKRQQLHTQKEPPRYWTFIDEAALRRLVGDRALMIAQLERVLDLARLPHVTIQVIPFTQGPYMCADSPFVMFEIKDPTLSKVVYRESPDRAEYLEKPAEIEIFQEAVDSIRAVAMPPKESIKRIARAISDFSEIGPQE